MRQHSRMSEEMESGDVFSSACRLLHSCIRTNSPPTTTMSSLESRAVTGRVAEEQNASVSAHSPCWDSDPSNELDAESKRRGTALAFLIASPFSFFHCCISRLSLFCFACSSSSLASHLPRFLSLLRVSCSTTIPPMCLSASATPKRWRWPPTWLVRKWQSGLRVPCGRR